jgi:Fe-S cluster assembly protein SufD
MQEKAIQKLLALGFPRQRDEAWTFFPVSQLRAMESKLQPPEITGISPEIPLALDIEENTDFAALLPLAFGAKSLFKKIEDNAVEEGILKPRDEYAHTVFEIGTGAKVSLELLENISDRDFTAERLDLFVAKNAEVELISLEKGHEKTLRFRHIQIHQAEGSTVRILDFNETGATARLSAVIKLEGENSRLEYRSLNMNSKETSTHVHLRIEHSAPHCISSQFVRNLLGGNAYASYDGSVVVGKNCSGTVSSQLVNTILLSDNAKISVKPVLKIYHDDVECTHGNTCGTLDSESLYYLQSRGLSASDAHKILMRAFAEEVILEHPLTQGRERVRQALRQSLETI